MGAVNLWCKVTELIPYMSATFLICTYVTTPLYILRTFTALSIGFCTAFITMSVCVTVIPPGFN